MPKLILAALLVSIPAASLAQEVSTDSVPLPILEVTITEVTSIPTRGPCEIEGLHEVLNATEPTFTVDTGCTEVTVALDGNRIVVSRVAGGEDFFVSFEDLQLAVPSSEHPYVPILVSYEPGQSSRLLPSYTLGGVRYLDAAGGFHPTCDCEYTFPAPSGSTIHYDRAVVVARADEHELVRFSALLSTSAPPDADGDGVLDGADQCPATPVSTPVDSFGCSQAEFCGAIELGSWKGVWACFQGDWMDDSPLEKPGDCMPTAAGCVEDDSPPS